MGSGRHNGNEGIIVEYWQREDDYHTDAVNTRRMGAVKSQTERRSMEKETGTVAKETRGEEAIGTLCKPNGVTDIRSHQVPFCSIQPHFQSFFRSVHSIKHML